MQTTRRVPVRLVLVEKDGDAPEGMAPGDSIVTAVDRFNPVIIGRARVVDVVVEAPSVGQRAVMVSLAPDGVWVEDLGSGGGSSVEIDGVITQRPHCRCPDQALLRIGRVGFRVEIEDRRLFDAVWADDRSTIGHLLRDGCEPNVRRDGLTPLHLASVNGFTEAARALIGARALVDAEAWPDLAWLEGFAAARREWSDSRRLPSEEDLRELPPPTVRDKWWRKVSSRTRRVFIGCNERGAPGCTPLHLACDGGHVEAVSLLLAHGADPYLSVYLDNGMEGFYEWTPMDLARGQSQELPHAEVLKVLETHMKQHAQSEASMIRQQRRRELIPI